MLTPWFSISCELMVRRKIVRIVANFSIIFYIFWDLIKNIETDGCTIIRVLKF